MPLNTIQCTLMRSPTARAEMLHSLSQAVLKWLHNLTIGWKVEAQIDLSIQLDFIDVC